MARQLVSHGDLPSTSAIPGPAKRLMDKRSDEIEPTLVFSVEEMETAERMFTMGRFRKGHYEEIVKDHLLCPKPQHKVLTQNLEVEKALKILDKDGKFSILNEFRDKLIKLGLDLRLAQRPFILLIGVTTDLARYIRSMGEELGYVYPEHPEMVSLFGPEKVPDYLTPSTTNFTPKPVLQDPLTDTISGEQVTCDDVVKSLVQTNHEANLSRVEDFYGKVVNLFERFYFGMKDGVLKSDSLCKLYTDVYGHVDGCFRELARNKAVQLFKPGVRKAVARTMEDKPDTGLLGGDDNLAVKLQETNKAEELVQKVTFISYFCWLSAIHYFNILIRFIFQNANRFKGKASRDRPAKNPDFRTKPREKRRRSRSRSRSRTRSPKRQKPSQAKVTGGSSSGGTRKGKRSNKPKKKTEKKSGIDNFWSPTSYEDAMAKNFFLPNVILTITALGLSMAKLPIIHALALGGRLKHCLTNWIKIGASSWVCDVVSQGYKIPLRRVPCQKVVPSNPEVSLDAFEVLVKEAQDLKSKAAVQPCQSEKGEYISSYFAVPKLRSPGKFRPILNLKRFNLSVKKYSFKMETLKHVREWLKPGAFCIGIDLKDAFPHIPIHESCWKYLRFRWLGQLLEWITLPFGLKCSPRVLTKVLKPVIAFLRSKFAILVSIYMDDLLIQANNSNEAYFKAQQVALVLMCLGWSLNWEKSTFIPSQKFKHLGFDFDTGSMTIACPTDKIQRLQTLCMEPLKTKLVTVHTLERMLGTMESVRPSTPMAALYYRPLQRQLLRIKSCWPEGKRYEKQSLQLSPESLEALAWWVSPTGFKENCSCPIRELEPTVEVWSDANLVMGGGYNSRGKFFQREWNSDELACEPHINLLEIRAAKEAVALLTAPGDRVRLHVDNVTAVAYIRHQGGTRSSILCDEAMELWTQALSRDVQVLTPQWIATGQNSGADFLSRHRLEAWEVKLEPSLFRAVTNHFHVTPTLDAFASASTAQLDRYMTWFKDSRAVAVDALQNPWDPVTYLFPPVPLMTKVLQKVQTEQIQAILIAPQWPTTLWWSLLQEMLIAPPLPLPHHQSCLEALTENQVPYLEPLVAVLISGRNLAEA